MNSVFEHDFVEASDRFPKLSYELNKKHKFWVITGELDICDLIGSFWGAFDIRILVPQNYPHCVPLVQELSSIIPRHVDWHTDKNGFCCIDIDHRLVDMSRRGIKLLDFITGKVYPFFANQLFKIREGKYAGEEYLHHFAGVVQFYKEDLMLDSRQSIDMLEALLARMVTRNSKCPCGSSVKLKRCHWNSYEFLKGMERAQLQSDLRGFRNKLEKDNEQNALQH